MPSAPVRKGAGATTGAVAPLAIDELVIADGLAGLQPTRDVQTASSPEEFTEAVDEDDPAQEASALEQAGFQEGAVVSYGDASAAARSVEQRERGDTRDGAAQKRRRLSSSTSFLS